ncbi:MAG: regulator of sigma protease [Solirubrobacteraceae bacterium]|nr:regulator of sigma protease [Solirubrobacteraceae bacterium]
MSYVLAFAGFALLIILHEAGHFAAAKAVGMRVERFALFFPPLRFKVRRGETEYGIGAIPLGGYVRITGMNPHEEIPEEHAHRAYFRQPVWKRIVVIAAGPLVNVLIAFVILTGLFVVKGEPATLNKVAPVALEAPARGALQPGDQLLTVDGRKADPVTVREALARHACKVQPPVAGCSGATPAVLKVRRHGQVLTLRIAPRYDATLKRMRLGFSFDTGYVDKSLPQSAGLAVSGMWRVSRETVQAIGRIFYDSKARQNVSGVVGSYEVTRESFKFDLAQALNVLAIVSLSLAVVNLFPFLPLDGGHIFWALAEKVRGRPISFSVIERASAVGFLLVIMLFVIGLSNDIGRLRGQGFGVR